MIKSQTFSIANVANTETLAVAITGSTQYKRRVKYLWFKQLVDHDVRAYIDQERVTDVSCDAEQADQLAVPIEHELADGEQLRVGYIESAGSAETGDVVVFWEEERTSSA